jgi:flagellar biosynthetic protein FlhB
MDAPVCVAKDTDAVALRIRDVAAEHSVPLVEDPPVARALQATVEID